MIGVCLILLCVIVIRPKQVIKPTKTTIHILVSLGGDQGNKHRYETYFQTFNQSQQEIEMIPFYVASDTHAVMKLIYSKQANQSYDIACLGADQIVTLADMNLVVALDEFILKNKGLSWLNQIRPIMLADAIREGEMYSVPFTRGAMALYYNQDKITGIGDSITLLELLLQKTKLMAPVNHLLMEAIVHQRAYGMKGEFILNEGDKVDLLNQYQKAMQENMIEKYMENGTQYFNRFTRGGVDMLVAGSEYYDELADQVSFSLGCVPLELYPEVSFPLQGNNLYLVNQEDEQKHTQVWNVMENMIDYGIPEGSFSILKEPSQGNEAFYQIANYDYNNASGLAIRQNSKIRLLTESMIINLLQGEGGAKKSLTQLQKQVDEFLQ